MNLLKSLYTPLNYTYKRWRGLGRGCCWRVCRAYPTKRNRWLSSTAIIPPHQRLHIWWHCEPKQLQCRENGCYHLLFNCGSADVCPIKTHWGTVVGSTSPQRERELVLVYRKVVSISVWSSSHEIIVLFGKCIQLATWAFLLTCLAIRYAIWEYMLLPFLRVAFLCVIKLWRLLLSRFINAVL